MPDRAKYTILRELGGGGMGKIFAGLLVGQSGFQRPIVIKQLRHAEDPSHVKLFVEEARRYAVLDHENIGRIFDFEQVDEQLCIILEYIDGWSLVEYLDRHEELGRLPDVDMSVFIVSRVCRALQYVYERAAIVHRDISPSNIMMTREGTVKLIDFGIATRAGTRDSSLTGKPAYMAPEMVVELRADNRSDLFSLGAVFFEMLCLQRLFGGNTAAEVLEQVVAGQVASPKTYNPNIPDGVMGLLRKALQRDPARRFASAAEMGAACEHYLYDKGYGPTNLTLKQYVGELFPETTGDVALEPVPGFPTLDATHFPISDSARSTHTPTGDVTPIAPIKAPTSSSGIHPQVIQAEGAAPSPRPDRDEQTPGVRTRRLKTRTRPR
jgi:serine/threonine protein kinase